MRDEKYEISILLFPSILSSGLLFFLLTALLQGRPEHAFTIGGTASVITISWCASLFLVQRKLSNKEIGCFVLKNRISIIVLIICMLCVSWFIICNSWGRGCLTLFPEERIDNSTQLIDTLSFSAYAEGFRGFLLPVSLINAPKWIHYHVFSCLLMRLVADLLHLPVFVAYNFLFPVIFLPIYIYSQLWAVFSAKRYFSDTQFLTLSDVIILTCYNIGILNGTILNRMAIWKYLTINSESFLLSNTILFILFGIAFHVLKAKKYKGLLLTIIIPVSILILTWTKVSAGALFVVSVVFYLFRVGYKRPRYWVLNLVYILEMILCLRFFNSNTESSTSVWMGGFQFAALSTYCKGIVWYVGHVIYLSILPCLFFALVCMKYRSIKEMKKNGMTIWLEEMIVICLFGFLPGMFFSFAGGTAVYFSYVIEIPALLLLCGCNYVETNEIMRWLRKKRMLRYAVIILFCVGCCIQVKYYSPSIRASVYMRYEKNGIYAHCMEIRNLAGKERSKHVIFLDSDSYLMNEYGMDEYRMLHTYTGLTGIEVINATYDKEGEQFWFSDKSIGADAWKIAIYPKSQKLVFDDAIRKARSQGFETMIHITKNGYDCIDLNIDNTKS